MTRLSLAACTVILLGVACLACNRHKAESSTHEAPPAVPFGVLGMRVVGDELRVLAGAPAALFRYDGVSWTKESLEGKLDARHFSAQYFASTEVECINTLLDSEGSGTVHRVYLRSKSQPWNHVDFATQVIVFNIVDDVVWLFRMVDSATRRGTMMALSSAGQILATHEALFAVTNTCTGRPVFIDPSRQLVQVGPGDSTKVLGDWDALMAKAGIQGESLPQHLAGSTETSVLGMAGDRWVRIGMDGDVKVLELDKVRSRLIIQGDTWYGLSNRSGPDDAWLWSLDSAHPKHEAPEVRTGGSLAGFSEGPIYVTRASSERFQVQVVDLDGPTAKVLATHSTELPLHPQVCTLFKGRLVHASLLPNPLNELVFLDPITLEVLEKVDLLGIE